MTIVVNISTYQLCWIACILGGANMLPLAGILFVAVAVAYHLYIAPKPGTELIVIMIAAIIGALWESLLVATGWLVYPSGTLIEGTAPYWIIAVWISFATTFNVSLRYFKQHLVLASALGAVGGPLAFLAGERLDGVVFTNHTAGIGALTLGWALLMPLMMTLSNRWDGFRQDEMAQAVPVIASKRIRSARAR